MKLKTLLVASVGLFYMGLPMAFGAQSVPVQNLKIVNENGSLAKVADSARASFHHGHHHHHHHHHGHHHFFAGSQLHSSTEAVPAPAVALR